MIGCGLIGAVGGIGCTVFAVRAAMHYGADVRSAVYRKIQSLSFGNLDRLGTGECVLAEVQHRQVAVGRRKVLAQLLVDLRDLLAALDGWIGAHKCFGPVDQARKKPVNLPPI
jgi:ABC-type multidrug transport system fused ATPase/permease subunit